MSTIKPEEVVVNQEEGDPEGVVDHSRATCNETTRDSVYQYLDRDVNTCESFKIEVKNLPRYASYATLKKLFTNKINVKPQKMKLIGNPVKFAFVAFTGEEEKERALKTLNGFEWKGKTLIAIPAAPKPDPLVVKRTVEEQEGNSCPNESNKKMKTIQDWNSMSLQELQETLNDQVCNFWRKPYEEQLKDKRIIVNDFLMELLKDLVNMISNSKKEPGIEGSVQSKEALFKLFTTARKELDRKACSLEQVIPSPETKGYRNKCEFSIGSDDKVVGFRLGSYKEGQLKVVGVDSVPFVSEGMKQVASSCQHFLQNVSSLKPFDNLTHEGHWKQVMVRSNEKNEHLVMMTVDSRGINEDTLTKEKQLLVESLSECHVSSLYFEVVSKDDRKQKEDRLVHVHGNKRLEEVMNINGHQLVFSVSPLAFFQINTKAAELCYDVIGKMLDLTEETLLLDICCGTGTIGLSLASRVKKVIGIELSKEAVDDAKVNASLNSITNIEFICGRAEETLSRVLSVNQSHSGPIIAVIDPPRAGLSQTVIKSIRSADKVTKLVYVSCDAKFAKQNLIDLCRPLSKVYRGSPFIPKTVVPVDMFPHTNRCELVFLYERLTTVV